MMNALLAYSLKSVIVLTLLYAPYTLLLRKERIFRQNRLTLIFILVLSLVLPLCNIYSIFPKSHTISIAEVTPPSEIQVSERTPIEPLQFTTEESPEPMAFTAPMRKPIDTMQWLAYLYMAGEIAILALRCWQFSRMRHIVQKGSLWHNREEGITTHCHAGEIASFSWMRHIVISQRDYEAHGQEILLHEKGHVLYGHSWDIMLLMLVQTVQWYNPFVYMFGESLRDIHEYEADDYALRQGISATQYQTLLLKTATGTCSYSFANNFKHSLIKNRIVMMKNKVSSPWRRWKVLYALPIIVIALCLFASPKYEKVVSVAKSQLEVAGKRTPYSDDGVYIYNPEDSDSRIYLGYYYTAEQLDSVFGERTKTNIDDEGWAVYTYGHEGVGIVMSPYQKFDEKEYLIGDMVKGIPADSNGMETFYLSGKKYKCQIGNVGLQVGDNINLINWEKGYYKYREDVFVDGSVRTIYIIDGYDWLFITHKNDTITQIRYDLDWT